MRIIITDELRAHLLKSHKKNIVVEVATTDHSDFDVAEIFLRVCDFTHREYLRDKRGYKEYPIEGIRQNEMAVLFKPYKLEVDEEVKFGLRKKWIFNTITYEGIRL